MKKKMNFVSCDRMGALFVANYTMDKLEYIANAEMGKPLFETGEKITEAYVGEMVTELKEFLNEYLNLDFVEQINFELNDDILWEGVYMRDELCEECKVSQEEKKQQTKMEKCLLVKYCLMDKKELD